MEIKQGKICRLNNDELIVIVNVEKSENGNTVYSYTTVDDIKKDLENFSVVTTTIESNLRSIVNLDNAEVLKLSVLGINIYTLLKASKQIEKPLKNENFDKELLDTIGFLLEKYSI